MQNSLLSRVHLVDVEELSLGEVKVVHMAVTLCVLVEMVDHVDYLALELIIHNKVPAQLDKLRPELSESIFIERGLVERSVLKPIE